MSSKKAINNLMLSINKLVNGLTDKEFEILESGSFELELKVSELKSAKTSPVSLDEDAIKQIIRQLDSVKSREEGLEIIESTLNNKKELEVFARYIDVAVMKSDRIDTIKNNIVDATVGAKLRSGAIQGKEI